MNKVFSLFLTVSTCLALLAGCTQSPVVGLGQGTDTSSTTETATDDSRLSQLREQIKQEDCKVGIAFIGYVDNDSPGREIKMVPEGSPTCQEYPFLKSTDVIMNEGQELYAIVPLGKEDRITVFVAGMTEDGVY